MEKENYELCKDGFMGMNCVDAIHLSYEDSIVFSDSVLGPPKRSPALAKLFSRYYKMIKDGIFISGK